jgi:hypothetical protein
LVHVGDTLLQGGQVPDLTLKDAIMMKLFCDLYISRVAHEALGFQLAREEEKKAANAAGGGGGMC